MTIELKVPTVGESITEVQLGDWLKGEGDFVDKDQAVVEIESDKATVELPAPASGKIAKIIKAKGQTAAVGEVVGLLDDSAVPAATSAPEKKPAEPAVPVKSEALTDQSAQRAAAEQQAARRPPAPVDQALPAPARQASQPWVMPAARRALAEHPVEARDVAPTGPGGRLLKEDVEQHLHNLQKAREASPPAQPAAAKPLSTTVQVSAAYDGQDEIVPMSPLRRRVAQRLVEAQQTAALLTTFNEIDMSAVMALRQNYREAFQQKYGIKLGFMSFFVKATIEALKRTPQVNAEIRGTDVVYHNYYDIGIAVGGGKGLVVPVLRGADRLSFAEVELAIADFGQRARENKIKIEELQGGTFTISNGGVYGSLLSTPIVNPPQSGILGLHAIQDRPVAHEGQVVIRPMMYVALTYDHRLVDGREAVLFLRQIKEAIEDPSRMLLEV